MNGENNSMADLTATVAETEEEHDDFCFILCW